MTTAETNRRRAAERTAALDGELTERSRPRSTPVRNVRPSPRRSGAPRAKVFVNKTRPRALQGSILDLIVPRPSVVGLRRCLNTLDPALP